MELETKMPPSRLLYTLFCKRHVTRWEVNPTSPARLQNNVHFLFAMCEDVYNRHVTRWEENPTSPARLQIISHIPVYNRHVTRWEENPTSPARLHTISHMPPILVLPPCPGLARRAKLHTQEGVQGAPGRKGAPLNPKPMPNGTSEGRWR